MDFPALNPEEFQKNQKDSQSPDANRINPKEMFGEFPKDLKESDYNYYTHFNENGMPKHNRRRDGILGPIIMFVDTDLTTAEWVGSVMVLVPRSSSVPTITFYDHTINVTTQGTPTKIGEFEQTLFYRFDVRVTLDYSIEKQIFYEINNDKLYYKFTVPSQTSGWRWCFFSCNGWSANVSEERKNELGGDNAVWDDLLNKHETFPFNVMLGGGDQLYADALWKGRVWLNYLKVRNKEDRCQYPFTPDMEKFIDNFYFIIYVQRFFHTNRFTDALTTIPSSFIIDDHDIFDGWGSYPEYLLNSNVFQGIKKYAFKYWLLFQAQTNIDLSRKHGYFGNTGFTFLKQMGPFSSVIGVDTRYERTLPKIVSDNAYHEIFARLDNLPPSTRHLFVLLGVPILYPRLTYVESGMNFMKKSGLTSLGVFKEDGTLASVMNQFGEPELLDDLNDHWTAAIHMKERKQFILRLQLLAKSRGIRVTFVAGDVHCCGAGRFATRKLKLLPENDYRMMQQIISSAIVNTPPPNSVIRLAHYGSKTFDLDEYTDEIMYELFTQDVNGKTPPNNNKKLLGRRNFASFAEDLSSKGVIAHIHVQKASNDGTVPYQVYIPHLALPQPY